VQLAAGRALEAAGDDRVAQERPRDVGALVPGGVDERRTLLQVNAEKAAPAISSP